MESCPAKNVQASGACSNTVSYEEVEIPVPWGHISGKWWGAKTKQPLIAIHGWQDNAGSFDELAPLLAAKGVPMLCIDLPGHGFSSHLPPGQMYYVFWDGVHFLRRILRYFKWEKVDLIGHSLGGAISFLYAAIFPEDVRQYIQIDIACPAVHSLDRVKSVQGPAIDTFLKYETLSKTAVPRYDYEEMVNIIEAAHRGSLTRRSCEIMLKRGMMPESMSKNAYHFTRDPRIKVSALGNFSKEQVLDYATRVQCRVLNIRADPGYQFEMKELYDQVLDTVALNGEVVRARVAGTHHLHLNDAASILDIIYDFLAN